MQEEAMGEEEGVFFLFFFLYEKDMKRRKAWQSNREKKESL